MTPLADFCGEAAVVWWLICLLWQPRYPTPFVCSQSTFLPVPEFPAQPTSNPDASAHLHSSYTFCSPCVRKLQFSSGRQSPLAPARTCSLANQGNQISAAHNGTESTSLAAALSRFLLTPPSPQLLRTKLPLWDTLPRPHETRRFAAQSLLHRRRPYVSRRLQDRLPNPDPKAEE